jgi:hypothetical protein
MSYLEHEADLENCGCPSCDLMDAYLKNYETYQKRKPYRVVEIKATGNGPEQMAELALNQQQERGYEMTAIIPADGDFGRLMVFRSVPPTPPSNSDVINEYGRRKEAKKGEDEFDFDKKYGPALGGKQ